jgi:arylsulfate sulfotransferase
MKAIGYCVILSYFLFSCSKKAEGPVEYFECSELDQFLEYFDDRESAGDYISSYVEEVEYYILNLSEGIRIQLEKQCIESLEPVAFKSQLNITFTDGTHFQFPYQNRVLLNYVHNPNRKTPLSGVLRVESKKEAELNIRVVNKHQNGNDLMHSIALKPGIELIPVLGLYFNHTNEIIFELSDPESFSYRDSIYVSLNEAPDYLPEIIIDKHIAARSEPGMNLVSSRGRVPSTPFIIDNEGEVRYMLDFAEDEELGNLNYDVGMERLKNGNFYFGNWPSNAIYEIDIMGNIVNTWDITPYEFHHNVQEKADGNLLVTASRYDAHISGKQAIEDWIIELERNTGEIINSWDLKESLDERRRVWGWAEYGNIVDWAHANAVIHDPRDNTIIVSCRTQCVVKLDYNNNVKWILSNHKQWGNNKKGQDLNDYLLMPLNASGQAITDDEVLQGEKAHPDFEWPWYQHAPFISSNGLLFLFDNGENRHFSPFEKYSRAVGYDINDENMTCQQLWQYGKERGIEAYSRIVSDVDQLPITGNIYFCPGSRVDNGDGVFGAKIIELDYISKEVIFEMRLNSPGIVFHRAERLSLYPD